MRKYAALFLALLGVILSGCGMKALERDLYRTDTVIYIPADPITEETKPVVLIPDYTVAAESSETETSKETAPETTKATTPKKTSEWK